MRINSLKRGLTLECKLVNTTELGLHTHFTGEILDVEVDEEFADEKGASDIIKIKSILYDPAGRNYNKTGEVLAKGFNIGKSI